MNLSKYKITSILDWADNLGRWVTKYKSDVYPIENIYLVLDDNVVDGTYKEPNTPKIDNRIKDVLDLNFWFICFQYEQSLNNKQQKNGENPSDTTVPSATGVPEYAQS